MGNTNQGLMLYLYLPIMIWMVLALILFVYMLKKYTFGNWTEENPNPYKLETFALPRGFFRGLLTLSLLFIVIIFEVINLTIGGFEEEIGGLMTAFQMMIAFYFGSKVMHHLASVDKNKTKAVVKTFTDEAEYGKGEFYEKGAAG